VTPEAPIVDTPTGKQPAGAGWFVLTLAEIGWSTLAGGGTWCGFEPPDMRSELLGIGVHILWPGDKPGFYHREAEQEGFLVLSGECLAIIEGEERRLGPWDYFHCPPGTDHITVGAGDGPCAIVMVGTRGHRGGIHYPVDEVAARHGASVGVATDSPREAYADRPPITPALSPWPLDGS
jgi:uncharacterized cupin superfamily protein